ncbi:MAG: low molecular weight phosphotyrosine protein phosphatase [Proteobacteria bacterium]|nr:low molecular weight phosphotyrosine protein phosphatase [Pseudomonadota bacterium]
MGNICRSPTAQGVFQAMVDEQGLGNRILVDSAGTHSYHIGSRPDIRSRDTALSHGVDLTDLEARQFESDDFHSFDFLLAMDYSNLSIMSSMQTDGARARLDLMLDYSDKFKQREVPDPYFGDGGFELVFDMISDASAGLLRHIKQQYSL